MSESLVLKDSVIVLVELYDPLSGVTESELHNIIYLACLMNLYAGRKVADWGYSFISSNYGAPFSSQIHEAINMAIHKGIILYNSGKFFIGQVGNFIHKHAVTSKRRAFRNEVILSACQSIISLSYSEYRLAIEHEPNIASAQEHHSSVALLDGDTPSYTAVYDQLNALKVALNKQEVPLFIPAIIWLKYLAKNNLHKTKGVL